MLMTHLCYTLVELPSAMRTGIDISHSKRILSSSKQINVPMTYDLYEETSFLTDRDFQYLS
jgi:hypothetical protein